MKPLVALFAVTLVACSGRIPIERESPAPPGVSADGVRLVAHPSFIHPGQTATLRWNAPNQTEVSLEQATDPMADVRAKFQAIGTYPPNGTLEVHPQQSVTYIVSCGNDITGCYSAAVHITVK